MSSDVSKWLSYVGFGFLVLLIGLLVFSFSKKGLYSQEAGINLVVVGELKVSLFAIRPKEGIANWVDIPGNLSVKVYTSGVSYPVVSLWKLGIGEGDQYRYLSKSLSLATGVALPRTIYVGKETSPESLLRALGGLMTSTDLSWRDRILLRKELTGLLSAKKILELEFPETTMDKVVEPDGKEIFTFNQILSLWNKNKFMMEVILGENINAKVNNSSGIRGQGTIISRQLEAAGLKVTEVSTTDEKDKERTGCYFRFGAGSHFFTERFVRDYLGCVPRNEKIEYEVAPSELVIWVF